MRLALLLLLLVACGARSASRPCPSSSWVLVRMTSACGDLRGGISGYVVAVVVDGPHRGERVVAYYSEGDMAAYGVNWAVARASFTPTTSDPDEDNACGSFPTSKPVSYAGVLGDVTGYSSEAAARRAFARM